MDDACNANPAQQNLLIPSPLPASCSPVYTYQLNNSQSDWDELNTVIDFIKSQHPDVGKVALIGWSAAAFQIGPYTLQLQQHADKVESVLFNAPVFPPNGRPSAPATPGSRCGSR
jgi:hypothetical protein